MKQAMRSGTTVPLIALQDLVIAKLLASRSQDLADAQSLWRIHGHAWK